MEDHEPANAVEPDIQDLISRWAGESKRLLVALPGVLAKLEDLEAETERLRQRLAELERENLALRQSREELAETFGKLRTLIAGTTAAADGAGSQRPGPGGAHAPSPEPTEPERATDSQPADPAPAHQGSPASAPPVSPEPSPRFAGREEKPPGAKPEEAKPPSSVRFSSVFRPPTRS